MADSIMTSTVERMLAKKLVSACFLSGNGMDAVQVWGLCDHQSWRAAKYPLLFDAQRSPKPAFWAVAEAAQ